jgi:heme O synthase-like polyprenyltransferase
MSTAIPPLAVPRSGALTMARDYAELTKLGVTTLIIMTAWCGYYFGALKSGISSFSWSLFHTLLGIGLVSGGTVCTFVGAFPGAMPGVLGWTAARGRLEWGALVMFAIVFFWQFPHFFSIAWLYREDYEDGGIRMPPVVEADGKSTARRILLYSLALIPISLLPTFLGMSGNLYLAGALLLGSALLYFGWPLAVLKLAPSTARSQQRARLAPASDRVLLAAAVCPDDAQQESEALFRRRA